MTEAIRKWTDTTAMYMRRQSIVTTRSRLSIIIMDRHRFLKDTVVPELRSETELGY